jgi:predicted RNA-binding Zn-ribbon protein involved in translation (DUF1610 family)
MQEDNNRSNELRCKFCGWYGPSSEAKGKQGKKKCPDCGKDEASGWLVSEGDER